MEGSEATSTVVHIAALSAVLLEKLEHPEAAHLASGPLKEQLQALNERAVADARSVAERVSPGRGSRA